MSGPSLAAILLIVATVMLVMSFWRQIAIFMLFVITTVFCLGVYYVITLVESII
jgi:hypothetical protein